MGSYFGRSSPKPSHEAVSRPYSQHTLSLSQSSLFSASSPISQTAPILPPIPRISDGPTFSSTAGFESDFGFSTIPENESHQHSPFTASSSSASSSPPSHDSPSHTRPQRLAAGRSMTSPDGLISNSRHNSNSTSPSSPLVAFSVPYSATTAQTKPRSGDRPLPAESTVKGIPQHAKMSKQKPELHSHKSSKGKFNLLNPVSLLMRRRSAQAVDTLEKSASKNLSIPPMGLPDDYDPRIRGNVVHDFSAPRTRRFPSYNDSLQDSSKPSTAHDSIPSIDSSERDSKRQSVQHTPVFVEQFDDEGHDDNRIHAETLANNDFVARNSWNHNEESISIPPFGRKSQQLDGQQVSSSMQEFKASSEPSSSSSQSDVSNSHFAEQEPAQFQSHVLSETSRPLSDDELPASTQGQDEWQHVEQQPQPSDQATPSRASGLPRHLTSTASRFSFQMAGNDSMAEEKMLEEKHRTRQSGMVSEELSFDESDEEDYEDDTFDENAMYDHDEMEDLPPNGVYQHRNSGLPEHIEGMTLESRQGHLSVASSNTLYSTDLHQPELSGGQSPPASPYHHQQVPSSFDATLAQVEEQPSPDSPNSLYFDDGMIDSINDVHDEEVFDENKFDDPSYLKRPTQDQAQMASPPPDSDENVHRVDGHPFLIQNPGTGHFSADSPFSEGSSQPGEQQTQETVRHDSQQGPLEMHHDLSAYHNALAEAAQKAAADGKFSRQNSVAASESVYSDDHEISERDYDQQAAYSHQSYMSASTHQSRPSYSGFDFGFSDGATIEDTFSSPEFPSDDFAFDDSDIISAANAEALANDEDGFYSQEFGFYARSRPGSDPDSAEAINGGYFGPPGIEIMRQKSVKEPNLTPITERSEFSARNSYIGPFSPLSAALPSPGFPPSQMAAARMSPLAWSHIHEDDMTLADLRRLKQGTFGGGGGSSSSSLHSMSSSFGGQQPYSPVMAPQNAPNGYFMPRASYGGVPMAWQRSNDSNSNSNYVPSNYSSSPITGSPVHTTHNHNLAASPVQAVATPNLGATTLYPPQPLHDDNIATPKKNSSSPQQLPSTPVTAKKATTTTTTALEPLSPVSRQTHSRNGSGADNITYVREQDSDGSKRWVLERRRTSEAGLLELVGREVVEGGRI